MTDILIVEDDKELSSLLTDFLRAEGYTVSAVENGERAVQLFERYGARLVVLDINLPDMNGFAVCSKLRENADTPILIVSARTDKEDKLNGLDLGADDYIEKPYDIDILLAKIKGIFKRRYQRSMLSASGVTLNLASKTAEIDGQPVQLSAKEFDFLALLIENQGKTLKKEYLFSTVWGSDSDSE
ncbi:response regulator transcription factor, partial [Ruminococcus sp.]|uniref:response regulator transcription factor n=1 Tax=Ruminococcus sp. TaxID=41978 RepID=UPI0025E540EF